MTMEETIRRINEFAREAKQRPLTDEELRERDALRKVYIDSVRANLTSQLDSTVIVEPDGTRHALRRRKEAPGSSEE